MTVAEIFDQPYSGVVHDALVAGVDVLAGPQEVVFTPYIRTVLPIDGFVFWLNAALATPAARATAGLSDTAPVTVQGSLHYASTGSQVEDETIVVRRVDFTSETQITAFAEIAPKVLWVGEWQTVMGSFKFTFSARGSYYQQANIHHYVGDAVYPVFEAQLIDDAGQLDQDAVVSNSLPIWLAMMQGVPFPTNFTVELDLFPSFLVPDNLTPPYGVVHIRPESTAALQSFPWRDRSESHWQLVTERVMVTLYGLRSDAALDFQDYAVHYSALTGNFGIMNMPVVRDDHRTQVELAALAMKKTIEFHISYYQTRARTIARQVLKAAIPTFYLSDKALVPPPPLIVEARP